MRFLRLPLFVVCLLATAEARADSANVLGCKTATDPDRVIEFCTKVIKSGEIPGIDGAAPYFLRGEAYTDKGQYDQAIEDFDAALSLRAEMPVVLSDRCYALNKKGSFAEAIESCSAALRRVPNYAAPYNNRCLARATLG
ncbi:MAG: tetratricopeptide repeat protein, partial [Dongiales bacterium]